MKQKIIEASIHLFDGQGFKETSIQEIVEKIGVTKGTFYYYFSSKQELLKDIHLGYIDDLIIEQEMIINEPGLSCSDKLHKIIYMVISNIKSQKKSARIFFREMRHLSDEHMKQIKHKRNVFRENYQKLIEQGISSGEFSDEYRADMLTFGILGITNWSYNWFNPEGELSEEELADVYTGIILKGIKRS
ncbi:TetR/AcrR family transcriptional regulator [Peribacillus sp. B-H-3]|uniref:TetR/AcrR family transcriptional regulator n=1 Tax=Peribacillus sp. B-H-3 TaxID=3400420 RepID=UPI003B02775F